MKTEKMAVSSLGKRVGGIVVFLSSFFAVGTGQLLFALEAIDMASGVDQSFTIGYAGRRFAEDFHTQETYGVPPEEPGIWEWQLHEGFSAAVTYDENIFSERKNTDADLIHTYSVPVSLTRKDGRLFTELSYGFTHIRYVENEELTRVNHNFGGEIRFKMPKLEIVISDKFAPQKAAAVGERTELKQAESSRVTTLTNEGVVSATYDLTKKTQLSFQYQNTVLDFVKEKNVSSVTKFDTLTHTFGPRLSYQWAPKTKIYGGCGWTVTDYSSRSEANDSTLTSPSVGIAGKLSPKTGFTFEWGWNNREYKHFDIDPIRGYTVKAGLSRKITDKVSASVTALRDTNEEVLDTDRVESRRQLVDNTVFNLSWLLSPRLTLDAEATAGVIDRKGLVTKRDVDNETLTFTREDDDDFYQWNIVLHWRPKPYVQFLIGYYFFNKNSTFKDSEYDDQRAVASVECQF